MKRDGKAGSAPRKSSRVKRVLKRVRGGRGSAKLSALRDSIPNLKSQLNKAVAQQAATMEILRLVADAPNDADLALHRIAEITAQLFGAAGVSFRIAEGDEFKLSVGVGQGAREISTKLYDDPAKRPMVGGRNLAGTVVRENRQIHLPDLDHLERLVTPATRALVVIDPNNPTGAVYSTETRRALLNFADRHGLLILADEVYGDLGFDGPVEPYGKLDPDAPIISFSSLSKAYLAPGWRTGWMACSSSPRLDDVVAAVRKLADGRLCSTVPMQYAIAGALSGDRSHQPEFRRALKARADLTMSRLCAMPGVTCVEPTAAFYAMPRIALPPGRTDEDYVKALLHATGVLCVYGSGFGLPAEEGFLRIVFLAPLDELSEIYDLMAAFTARYLS